MARGIGIKIGMERLAELFSIYSAQVKGFELDGEHDELLYAHCIDMHHKLKQLVARGQERYTFRLTNTEAIAFKQLWQRETALVNLYGAEIIRSIMSKVNMLVNG